RTPGGALCPLGGHLSPVRSGVQHLGGSLGRLHRPLWHGGANGRGHGDLSGRGRGAQASGAGGHLTREALLEAVTEGALLRLRPKVMTVSTVVASLLPIMWSHSTGAEVMKPLATPVLGGMVSSLAHVLLVTPVIFYWLREREIQRETEREAIGTDLALQGQSMRGSAAGHSVPTTERSNN